ncbi:UNVERIFIED_CONTAM: hypothetical protein Sindi_1304800 [Sesamum indicum]
MYGTEAIIPAENGEESQRVPMYDPETNQHERSFELTVIEEKRDAAYARILHHKGLMMKSHDRRIRPRQLQVGDLVLKKAEASKHVGKLEPPWEGPYKVTEIKKKGTSHHWEPVKGHQLQRDRILGTCERLMNLPKTREPVKGHQLQRDRISGAYERPINHPKTKEPVKGHQLRRDRTIGSL